MNLYAEMIPGSIGRDASEPDIVQILLDDILKRFHSARVIVPSTPNICLRSTGQGYKTGYRQLANLQISLQFFWAESSAWRPAVKFLFVRQLGVIVVQRRKLGLIRVRITAGLVVRTEA